MRSTTSLSTQQFLWEGCLCPDWSFSRFPGDRGDISFLGGPGEVVVTDYFLDKGTFPTFSFYGNFSSQRAVRSRDQSTHSPCRRVSPCKRSRLPPTYGPSHFYLHARFFLVHCPRYPQKGSPFSLWSPFRFSTSSSLFRPLPCPLSLFGFWWVLWRAAFSETLLCPHCL